MASRTIYVRAMIIAFVAHSLWVLPYVVMLLRETVENGNDIYVIFVWGIDFAILLPGLYVAMTCEDLLGLPYSQLPKVWAALHLLAGGSFWAILTLGLVFLHLKGRKPRRPVGP